MFSSKQVWAVVAVVAIGCGSRPPETTKDYVSKIAADRAAKDTSFEKDAEPVPANKKPELLPLSYFPIDPDYGVPAALKPIADTTPITMPTSSGEERKMRRVGTLEFAVKGQPLKLTAFVEVGTSDLNRLFVPFMDLTNVTETYGGGRYLDLDRTATGVYEIDFNRAYTPYCYYNPTYDCPYPPPENRLKVAIRAGEKLKKPEL